ncbi:hypothetical protein OG568_45075 [Streptomyces sp. NBC_01450]|uniref:hypothetical protein n=1 Tax=Streptomyces sp. NBC_01450 TaxID=2903871 RepID=UPI002E32E4CD|nr:hypothetical protein [Streptomyces sp. NBC_01450]
MNISRTRRCSSGPYGRSLHPGSGLLEADFGRAVLSGAEGTTAVWLVAEAPPGAD